LEKQRLIEVEEQVPRSDGSTSDFVVFKFPLSDSSGHNVIAGMAIDITERKAMDRMKNEFISVVSHELRTPVTSIRGAIGLIIGGAMGEVPHGMGPLLQIANKNSIRLAELLNDILDLGKIESGQLPMTMELLEIEPLAAIAVDINGPYAREHHTHFVLESEVAEAKVMGDSDRLQQVMANLLSNAAKYSPPERSVRVRVERIRADGHPWIRVSVTNWGPPIPTSFHSRIFSKFAQADSSTTRVKGGTGLGLSISKAIIEKLGGRIGFTSSETEGTTFYFDLREVV
jgi:signal transduction histidine kinase